MTPTRRGLIAGATGLALLPAAARAQAAWPERPVRVIVAFPGGSTPDMAARAVTGHLAQALGQPFVVDNRAGAGGVIGVDAVAKARPDGQTLGIGSSGALSVLPNLMPRIPYEVARDIQPVSLAIIVPQVLAVHPGVPARTVAELVALARADNALVLNDPHGSIG
jgi:tripartite-type tricarboxylate transporter receptor subunit TctC